MFRIVLYVEAIGVGRDPIFFGVAGSILCPLASRVIRMDEMAGGLDSLSSIVIGRIGTMTSVQSSLIREPRYLGRFT